MTWRRLDGKGRQFDTLRHVTLDGELYYDCALERLDPEESLDAVERWNGWLCPYLDRENVTRLIRDIENSSNPDDPTFDWDGDVIVMRPADETEEVERFEPIEIDWGFPAGVQLYWRVGSWAWTWSDMERENLDVVGTVTVPTEITMEDIKNLSITACEGGIGYWSVMTKGAEKGHATYQYTGEFEIVPNSDDGDPNATWHGETNKDLPTPFPVTKEVWLRGLQLYCDGKWYSDGTIRQHAPREVLDDLDSDVADNILQLGVFGEVVYG